MINLYLCADGHECLIPAREKVSRARFARDVRLLAQDVRDGHIDADDALCSNTVEALSDLLSA